MIVIHCDCCGEAIYGRSYILEGHTYCKTCIENIFGLVECIECGHLNDEDENICENCSLPIYK